jgi:hypothetical protein
MKDFMRDELAAPKIVDGKKSVLCEPGHIHCFEDFRRRHKRIPHQLRAMVLNHQ